MTVELLFDARAELGEGPIWEAARQSLSWVDILGRRVHRLGLDGNGGPSIDVGRRVGSAVPIVGGGLMLATDAGFAQVDDAGRIELVAPIAHGTRDWFMNDGKCDALGRFWAGTVVVADDGNALRGGGSLYRLDTDGTVHVARSGVTLSNGMDWSPDGRTFYYVDSRSGGIDAHSFDLETGALGPARRAVDLGLDPAVAFADGMCVDADGALWTAVWGAGEVRRYTPGGVLDRTIRLPVTQPTSCTFAGDQLDVLVITSAWHRLSPAERAAQPLAGSIFCASPGVTGQAAQPYGTPR